MTKSNKAIELSLPLVKLKRGRPQKRGILPMEKLVSMKGSVDDNPNFERDRLVDSDVALLELDVDLSGSTEVPVEEEENAILQDKNEAKHAVRIRAKCLWT
ncbi:hypothetical protein Ancab_034949 [Ancistrocladus abbreviatus]